MILLCVQIEYKTKFPTSLCRDKVRQLVHLKNKVNSQHWVYLCHADVITTHSTTGAIKSSFSYLPFDPSIEDYSPINCLHGKVSKLTLFHSPQSFSPGSVRHRHHFLLLSQTYTELSSDYQKAKIVGSLL